MISSDKIKQILEELGYKLHDKGKYWQTSAIYRNGDNETALQIYKDTGAWKDYVKNTPFMTFKKLLILTLNTNDAKELSKYLNKEETFYLSDKSKTSDEKIEMEDIYPESCLSSLLPHYKFYNDRGIDSDILKNFNSGLATKGQMYQRYVFPIYNQYGQIHGFSGRDMSKKSDKPKWKHMGKKKSWVYPAYVPTDSGCFFDGVNKDYVLLVESIGDCLSCMQNGISNVLVSFGLDISSKLLCSLIQFNFDKVILSFNNDSGKSDNRGMNACIKNYLKLLTYYDSNKIKICLPMKNDFGDMNELDFAKWREKLNIIQETDQKPKIISAAKKLERSKGIPKVLQKNLKHLYEQT